MNIYTAHTRPRRAPELLREGFTWGGLVFGPFWLLAQGAWVAGVLALCADVLIAVLARGDAALVLAACVSWLIGLFGQDLRRWTLARRGFHEVHVLAAPDEDTALAGLLDRRPDLIEAAVGAELRR